MRRLFLVAAFCALTTVTPALAQGDTRAAYDAAFQDMLLKPMDPPTVARFVALAEQVGDLNGAVAALERLLRRDPGQPDIHIELAALYLKLGANASAKAHADAVVTSSRASAENRADANAVLAQVAEATTRSKFSGDFFVGMQYSSNANSGASGPVLVAGTSIVPTPSISRTPDWAVVGGGLLHHRYNLQTDDHAAIESDFAFYGARQFQVTTADTLLFDLTSGPRFDLLRNSVDGLTARPFFTGRYVSQHDLTTYWGYGTGLELAKEISATTRVSATALGRRREFQNNADAPTNWLSSGNELLGVLSLESQLAPWLTLRLGTSATRYIATVSWQSYQEYSPGFTAILGFADPLGLNGEQWTVTLSGSAAFAAYDAPDPAVDPSTTRTQRDLVGSLIVSVPVRDQLALVAQATYTDRAASIPNYTYNAATVMMGVSFHF